MGVVLVGVVRRQRTGWEGEAQQGICSQLSKINWNPLSTDYVIHTYLRRLLLLNPWLYQRKGWRFQQQPYPCAFVMPRVAVAQQQAKRPSHQLLSHQPRGWSTGESRVSLWQEPAVPAGSGGQVASLTPPSGPAPDGSWAQVRSSSCTTSLSGFMDTGLLAD